MNRALIFLNGSFSDPRRVKEYASHALLICADGGALHARNLGLTPHVLVGDLDSIAGDHLAELEKGDMEIVRYPAEKDMTDGELAIEYALEKGCKELVIAGILGDRVDHFSANLMYLAKIAEQCDIRIMEKDQDIFFVRNGIEIRGKKGDEVSLVPMLGDCHGVTTGGLTYQLTGSTLPWGSTRGISNVMDRAAASVRTQKGVLMVVHRIL
ncbi:thiamine diphosphokinase [Candidatus Woesebacteria bacterium]|nr:thiamine diphosphokinase [Candidatus Woesebacteria bacterium]